MGEKLGGREDWLFSSGFENHLRWDVARVFLTNNLCLRFL